MAWDGPRRGVATTDHSGRCSTELHEGSATLPGMAEYTTNAELADAFDSSLRSTDIAVVNERQSCSWLPDSWRATWETYKLPHPEVVEELASHYRSGRPEIITRRFVLGFASRDPIALLVASMAWGYGNTGYGAKHLREMLADPVSVRGTLEQVLNALDEKGLAAGFCLLFDELGRARIPHLGVAFGTKFLYFARYESALRPRPLIYDARVAHAVTHLPSAPMLPCSCDGLSADRYVAFCQWAEDISDSGGKEPSIVEYVAFQLGKDIADSVRYRTGRGRRGRNA